MKTLEIWFLDKHTIKVDISASVIKRLYIVNMLIYWTKEYVVQNLTHDVNKIIKQINYFDIEFKKGFK